MANVQELILATALPTDHAVRNGDGVVRQVTIAAQDAWQVSDNAATS